MHTWRCPLGLVTQSHHVNLECTPVYTPLSCTVRQHFTFWRNAMACKPLQLWPITEAFGKRVLHELISLKQKVEHGFSNILCAGCVSVGWQQPATDLNLMTGNGAHFKEWLSLCCCQWFVSLTSFLIWGHFSSQLGEVWMLGNKTHAVVLQNIAYCTWILQQGKFENVQLSKRKCNNNK